MQIHKKYANLLVNYCLEVQEGDEVLIRTTYLAEPLLKELLKAIAIAGGHPVMQLSIEDQEKITYDHFKAHQLKWVNPLSRIGFESFNCFLGIRAPFNLRSGQNIDPEKRKIAKQAFAPIGKIYSQRTAVRDLKRNSCLFPTSASAQEAGMSLEEYEHFVYQSCYLYDDDPIESWKQVGKFQQGIVDFLNQKEKIRYVGNDIDISFSCKGRTWMNSDGKTNMPSGEVYTAPVDDSTNGFIRFSYPGIFQGREVEDIRLEVKDGKVVKWDAKRGKEVLDHVMTVPGANRFGEAAIGTNMNIQQMTKNILFDEKIGGTIHMALGQAYLQCGGTNDSTIHWDMITNMKDMGEIYADDELIYEKGKFLI